MTASYRAVSPCAVNPAMAARTCSRSAVSSWTTTGWSEKATTPIRVPGSILVAKASAAALARSMLSGEHAAAGVDGQDHRHLPVAVLLLQRIGLGHLGVLRVEAGAEVLPLELLAGAPCGPGHGEGDA